MGSWRRYARVVRRDGSVLLLAVAALSACSGSPAVPNPAPAESVAPPAFSSTTDGVPSLPEGRREAALKSALLALSDMPAGFSVGPEQFDDVTTTSSDPKCATLVMIQNNPTAVGSLHHVGERLSGGPRGPFVDETIDALDSPNGVVADQAQLKAALADCTTVTVTYAGQQPSTEVFKTVPPPQGGQNPVAYRVSIVSGHAAGFEFTQVIAGVANTVVLLSFVETQQGQIDQIVAAALDRAARVLAGAGTGTS